jgi:hypothetical protein
VILRALSVTGESLLQQKGFSLSQTFCTTRTTGLCSRLTSAAYSGL